MPAPSITRTTRTAAAAAARRPKLTVAIWFALVVALAVGGSLVGTRSITDLDAGVGQSGHAERVLAAAHLSDPAVENVLITSSDARTTQTATVALERRLTLVPTAYPSGVQRTSGGRIALVRATLRGDPDDASGPAEDVARAVATVRAQQPAARLQQAGDSSIDAAIGDVLADDLHSAELVSLPVTLAILIITFGALLAASIPLVLGLSAVAAAIGGMAFVSQITPVDDSAFSLIVLIGLAVGVDYSLFAVRRLREERENGRTVADAVDVTAATVGRAVVVSGATVVIAIAGLLLTGLSVFVSVAAGTILVVVIAVLGALTVLPALLTLGGERVARGPRWRPRTRRDPWRVVAGAVTRRPVVALTTAVCLLGSLCAVATQLTTGGDADGLPRDVPIVEAQSAIRQAFPGAPAPGVLVVRGHGLGARRAALTALGERARRVAQARGPIALAVARDGRTAAVTFPMPDGRAGSTAVGRIRAEVVADPTIAGVTAQLAGEAAGDLDFDHRLAVTTPIVVGGVLLLAFGLLVASFGSAWLAAGIVALNLLSVGAAYGVVVGVFQHTWAEGVLGFTSSGAIVSWLPLLAFVILFGISMDYTVLVLERVREARRAGLGAREAAAEGVARTAGSVTSAAVVMVAVFAILGSLQLLSMKQMGVGLAAAVLLDATIVRALALPALLALLGERRWRPWNDRSRGVALPTGA